MANPPFAGDIKQTDMLAHYEIGVKANGKLENAVGRDLLFVERNLDFLKPGGRMAIVLPQGRLNNSSDQRIREFIMKRCRIIAVVGLHPNTFKPHTNTKTSVLFVQRWNDDVNSGPLCPRTEDYNIFFATQQTESIDNSGNKVYVYNEDGTIKRDDHGHFIVAHDLFNHDGFTKDGIAEAFQAFAERERFSFLSFSSSNKNSLEDLFKGLDASIVSSMTLDNDNPKMRLDSQFQNKTALFAIETIRKLPHRKLAKILDVNTRGRQPQYANDGLPVVNSKHVRTNRVIIEGNRLATEAGSPVIIQNGDVLLNATGEGTIGRAAPYLHNIKALPDNHVTVLRTTSVDPIYLSVFLNSRLGQLQIQRHIKGSSGQIELYPNDIAQIVVWDAPDKVQAEVRNAVLSAFESEHRAKELLEAAKRAVEITIKVDEDAAFMLTDNLENKT
jgi:type I restriction enzyme M protein